MGINVDRIRSIRVGLNRQAYEAVCTPVEVRKAPRTVVQAQFSIPYTVATAFVDGGVRLEHFSDAALQRKDILALAAKVEAFVDEEMERQMEDGSTHRLRMDVPEGHPSRPISRETFGEKAADCFRAASRPLRDGASQELRALVDNLESLDDARKLVQVLQPAA